MGLLNGETIDQSDLNIFSGFTAFENITAGDAVAMRSDFTIGKASAAAFDWRLNFIGFAIQTVTTGNVVKIDIQRIVRPVGASLTANSMYFLSNTQGAIATTAGTFQRQVGRAISTTVLVRKYGPVSAPFKIAGLVSNNSLHTLDVPVMALVSAGSVIAEASPSTIGTGGFNGITLTNGTNSTFIVAPFSQVFERAGSSQDGYAIIILDFGQVF